MILIQVYTAMNVPHSDSVYGFFVDPLETQFLPWMQKAPEFT